MAKGRARRYKVQHIGGHIPAFPWSTQISRGYELADDPGSENSSQGRMNTTVSYRKGQPESVFRFMFNLLDKLLGNCLKLPTGQVFKIN
jgi:hypothetical protein